jgi:outer membrane lipoprotein-sorting protein
MKFSQPTFLHLFFLRFFIRSLTVVVVFFASLHLNTYQASGQNTGSLNFKTVGIVEFSQSDTNDVFRIEAYLNSIKTLKSRFLQVTSAGDYSEGTLSLSKPGKMRLEYDHPNPALLVADGSYLAYFDRELEQVSYFDLQSTQAAILLNNKISFSSGKIAITAFERGPNVFRLTLIKGNNPNGGSMMMIFSDKPLRLKKWTITDAQGILTNVSLISPRFGLPLNPKQFIFEEPKKDLEN